MGEIKITRLAADQYIQGFNPFLADIENIDIRIKAAANVLLTVLKGAKFISEKEGGKLYRNYLFGFDMIIRDNTMVTLFPLRLALKSREGHRGFNKTFKSEE